MANNITRDRIKRKAKKIYLMGKNEQVMQQNLIVQGLISPTFYKLLLHEQIYAAFFCIWSRPQGGKLGITSCCVHL